METFGTLVLIIIVVYIIVKIAKETDSQRKARLAYVQEKALKRLGPISPMYICPHCQQKGFVRTIPVKRKKGVSGAKATGAILTLGFSMLATGLSRKEGLTQATCGKCNSTWDF